MNAVPHELAWGEIYIPPLLLVVVIAYVFASTLSFAIAKFGWHKYVAHPALAELSLVIIFTGIISQFITTF
ncbi:MULTISPECIES: DUF1656 domain-containing protein [Vibrio]|uniref:DUF1656 domain-containing protein n=1 Tax=Vibrio aestuarianus TaxID=28171 RepID=A0A9X4EW56_9VIBR|nr:MULTISPECIES: DUF1656 domain-containing protein [Vibrio]MDE1231475.1 DUF1656 domain-containing protein [Vibrio aestuarianus]MDE1237085.1 DUF1656 domain-containing protein [Vibrio aestuarianus]MDE1241865.1 DUF1656 domain-containing protein [Vibrio aestuarianus]MDE1247969.1 DUF1656 domain-containing protein [Vibrio aestuarianus]MDE1265487.1 DUF1656 domain-containing protein [Vibrio aestuarianus]